MRDLLLVAGQPCWFELRCRDHQLDGMTGDIVIAR